MSPRLWVVLVISSAVAVLNPGSGQPPARAQDKPPTRGKWEYKIVRRAGTVGVAPSPGATGLGEKTAVAQPGVLEEGTLSALGEQGWELIKITGGQPFVSTFRVITPPLAVAGATPYTVNTIAYSDTIYYFKRAK